MSIELLPLHPHFVVEVRGVDLRAPLPDADFEALHEAFDRHSVLVFRDQPLDVEAQVRFSERFGPLERAITALGGDDLAARIAFLSNVDEHGRLRPPDDRQSLFHAANRLWHTDSTYKPVTAIASMLAAKEVPPSGGETEYASTRAAYEALDPATKARLEGLRAVHDFTRSRNSVAPGLVSDELRAQLPPVERPLLRRNPRTGATSLYVASHATGIVGMPHDEGRALLDELIEWCTRDEFVYRHAWAVDDLVMWDNRATMHRGRPWNDAAHRRVMHRTTVQDREAI